MGTKLLQNYSELILNIIKSCQRLFEAQTWTGCCPCSSAFHQHISLACKPTSNSGLIPGRWPFERVVQLCGHDLSYAHSSHPSCLIRSMLTSAPWLAPSVLFYCRLKLIQGAGLQFGNCLAKTLRFGVCVWKATKWFPQKTGICSTFKDP